MSIYRKFAKLVAMLTVTICFIAGSVYAEQKMDTLTGMPLGHLIGGYYTFQNGDFPIPIAQDTVDSQGNVSFLKPSALFDNVEYFDFTTNKPIVALINQINTPINTTLTNSMEFPILYSDSTFNSFFDVFFEIDLPLFINNDLDHSGTFKIGQSISFNNGASTDYQGITIDGYTGTAYVGGFDKVSTVPEPATMLLLGLGLMGLVGIRKRFKN